MDILGDANVNQEQKYKITLYPRVVEMKYTYAYLNIRVYRYRYRYRYV